MTYSIFFSKIIKEYGSDRDYVKEELVFMTDKQVKQISSEIKKSNNIAANELDSVLAAYENGWLNIKEDGGTKKSAAITDLLRLHWKSENHINVVARFSVFVFFIVGLIALAYPSTLMFKKVANAYTS